MTFNLWIRLRASCLKNEIWGRVHDTARLSKEGLNPTEIARELGISLDSVFGYLHRAVGERYLRRSDIYFSFPADQRTGHSQYLDALGDMYEDIRRIEVSLHSQIRRTLVHKYGDGELGWWRRGIPEAVRVKCQERREKDPDEPCEVYCYTDLLDLGRIMETQWPLFKDVVASRYSSDRRRLRDDLTQLNGIRNKIMHPVRGMMLCEADFDFVRRFEQDLGLT